MTTNKELAETWRKIADCYESLGNYPIAVADARRKANELDPPKPEYPDGTIAWVDYGDYDFRQLCVRVGDGWLVGNDQPLIPDGVHKVEPLRVLADDEIALPRAAFGHIRSDGARRIADALDNCGGGHVVSSCVWLNIADALDAEAGDQS